ncbi:MAG: electron transfer flavoprotein subunit alpha/FixB family protein [Anaerolineae bacterium]|jgi:electron transfer flavoprotein alpha subunit
MDASYLDLVMARQEEAFEEAEGGGGVWVVADVVDAEIAPVTFEAAGAARTLADSLGAYVFGVLLGEGVTELAESLYQAGADAVRVADHPALKSLAVEPCVHVLACLFDEEQPEVVLFGARGLGKTLAPRLAQRLGGGLIEHVTAVTLDEATRTVEATFPVYGGEYFEIAACPEARPQVLTIKPGAFPKPYLDEFRRGEPTMLDVEPVRPAVRVVGPAEAFGPPPTPLSEASMIVAVGRQAGDLESVEQLTEMLGAQLAGDRGAWDAGLIQAEQIVDVRGVTVSPDVYVAVGIRGNTFHNAAMQEASFIVAIHPDPEAPIFEVADLCVAADPDDVLPEMLQALKE